MGKKIDVQVDELLHSVGLLLRRVRAASVSGAASLSLSESAVLARLAKHGPATAADLARAESVKPQSMGATIAFLSEEDLVERRPHPTDGRQMLIHLTEKGSALRTRHRAAKRGWLTEAIAQLPPDQQVILWHAAEIMRRLQERPQERSQEQ